MQYLESHSSLKKSLSEDVHFYSLFYIRDSNETSNIAHNSRATIQDYIKCCKTLSDSLLKYGFNLTVLTNNSDTILKYQPTLNVKEIDFFLDVPHDIRFHAAHHKIDVYHYLSQHGANYSILLDNDVLCINDINENMVEIIMNNIPTYYDITDQVYPAYGRPGTIKSKSLLMGKNSLGVWVGGEFLGGDKTFFKEIFDSCMSYWDLYVNNYKILSHQGDEMLTSCAIENYFLSGKHVFNVGTIGGIGRFWSVPVKHIPKPLEALYDHFLIHLPADKEYLLKAKYSNIDEFKSSYHLYRIQQKAIYYRIVRKMIREIRKKVGKRP